MKSCIHMNRKQSRQRKHFPAMLPGWFRDQLRCCADFLIWTHYCCYCIRAVDLIQLRWSDQTLTPQRDPKEMICETNEEYLQGLLLSTIVDDCIFEECIDVSLSFVAILYSCLFNSHRRPLTAQMMWRVRTNGISLDEIYDVEPLDSIFAMEKLSGKCSLTICVSVHWFFDFYADRSCIFSCFAGMQASSGSSNGTVNCPICSELVSGKRFAPHLEKCMNGGKRGSKRHYDYLHEETGSKTQLKPKAVEIVEQQDPHPSSLIVRLKLRNGGKQYSRYGYCT